MAKIMICVDGDGHFHIAPITDKRNIIRLLKRIEDGDFWANEVEDNIEGDIEELDGDEWIKTIESLSTRGRLEIVDIELGSSFVSLLEEIEKVRRDAMLAPECEYKDGYKKAMVNVITIIKERMGLIEEYDNIDYDGHIYWYEYRLAKHRKDICLGTTDPKKYCNGLYLYSDKDPGDGKAFVVTKTTNPEYPNLK